LLKSALSPLNFEIIFVDGNSPDGTADAVRALSIQLPEIKCLQRFDRQLTGWKLLSGWSTFCAASSVGVLAILANLGVALFLSETMDAVWFASVLGGFIVGSAWKYAVAGLYTWKSV
jgi:glycosyltransferase involved in cell wall biosynthesis